MCFSATFSFGLGTVILLLGISALRAAQSNGQYMLAIIPLGLGIQQLTEGILWLNRSYLLSPFITSLALYTFVFFAFIVWPLWIGLSLAFIERYKKHETILWFLSGLGGLLAIYFSRVLLCQGVGARIVNNHLQYITGIPEQYSHIITTIYLLATAGPFLVSTRPYMRPTGILVAAGYGIAYFLFYSTLISVWCFFAALISPLIVASIYKQNNRAIM